MSWPGRHFTREEFLCKCELPKCDAPTIPEPALVTMLDQLRDDVRAPLVITSGLRCYAHNIILGGEPNSGHLFGTEVDLSCPTSRFRFRLLYAAITRGVRRIGIYPKHIHLGLSSTPLPKDVIWLG